MQCIFYLYLCEFFHLVSCILVYLQSFTGTRPRFSFWTNSQCTRVSPNRYEQHRRDCLHPTDLQATAYQYCSRSNSKHIFHSLELLLHFQSLELHLISRIYLVQEAVQGSALKNLAILTEWTLTMAAVRRASYLD